ncbi:MAG TPA: type IVB secretion system protein IcmW [Gammaproteobacteria bacterium]|nr:type IVB secretion system protein IcmW [Gammaproteobacteria bacterium]
MPDLSPQAVQTFWQERHDYALFRIIMSMESVEDWCLDKDPEYEAALTRFTNSLDDLKDYQLAEEEKLIQILVSLRASRAFRILQHIDGLLPGSASKLLVFAEVASNNPEDIPGFFLKRNLVFERLQLLGRIFARERFKLVMSALEKAEK